MLFRSGIIYLGEWKDSKFHGQGTYYNNSTGDEYVGEFKDGKRKQGTFTWANGDRYVGEFKDDQAHGQGIFTFANGDEYVGEFKDGKLIELKEQAKKKLMKMEIAPTSFDFVCYNACKERNEEAFCRQKCSMQ